MDAPYSARIALHSEKETTALGQRLAAVLSSGDTVLLKGPIGAGKTHLARAIIQARLDAAGLREDVPSPTYTLVQVYSDGKTDIWHADLYRLTGPQDVLELGLDDAFETAIVLVEWPDRLGQDAPPDALHIELSVQDDDRLAHLSSPSGKWHRLDLLREKAS